MFMGCCTLTELNYHNGAHVGNRFVTTPFSISLSLKKCVDPHLLIVLVLRVGSPCVGVRKLGFAQVPESVRDNPIYTSILQIDVSAEYGKAILSSREIKAL